MICADTSRNRVISSRAGVGTTAQIVQREALRLSRLVISQPTLIVVRHGTKVLTCGSDEWVVRSGEGIAIAEGKYEVVNWPAPSGAYEASWLAWDPSLLAAFSCKSPPMASAARRLGRLTSDFTEAFARARDAIQNERHVPTSVAQHRLHEILLWLDGLGVNFALTRPATFSDRVRGLLSSEPGGNWPTPEVARRMNMSEATLRRHLAAEDTTLGDLLGDIRMSQALTLLQSTDIPVGLIARDVGYESASRFAIRFRRRFGFAPTAIRGHKRAGRAVGSPVLNDDALATSRRILQSEA